MTSTNRFANRLMLLLVGLILLLAGLAAVSVMLVPSLTTAWNQNARRALTKSESFLRMPAIPGTGASWALAGTFALLIVLIVLLIVFIFRQGHGRTRHLVVQQSGENGTTVIESGVAVDLIDDALAGEPEILAVHVAAYEVRGTAALKITVTCRRGASPRNISYTVDECLVALDWLLGVEVPVLVQISGGFRTRLAPSARRDQTNPPSHAAPVMTNSPATVALAVDE